MINSTLRLQHSTQSKYTLIMCVCVDGSLCMYYGALHFLGTVGGLGHSHSTVQLGVEVFREDLSIRTAAWRMGV